MKQADAFRNGLAQHAHTFHQVVAFDKQADKLLRMDFTSRNRELTPDILADTTAFSHYIDHKLKRATAKYGIGGYNEHRTIYSRSELFNNPIKGAEDKIEQPRRLHLGIDIWGEAGTAVHAPLNATVHSFAYNGAFGDYGATVILQHQLDEFRFHTLYGHLNLKSIQALQAGKELAAGQTFAAFGEPQENGHWPPHLHFQIILDMQEAQGDYPGVCAVADRERYLQNCPDPDLLLGMMAFATEL